MGACRAAAAGGGAVGGERDLKPKTESQGRKMMSSEIGSFYLEMHAE
jgi:hypothetical protein